MMCRSIDSLNDLYDRGMLTRCIVDSVECLRRPNLGALQAHDPPQPCIVDLPKMPILYQTKTVGSKVYIAKEEIPAFLQDNGLGIMNAEEVASHLESKLEAYFPISECKCLGKYNIHGKVVAGSLGSPNDMAGLKPGEARYKIKINEDFSKYTEDPAAYEQKVKEGILQALGLDPAKIPGAKKHIKIEDAKEGCIDMRIVISLVLIVVPPLMVFLGFRAHQWVRKQPRVQSLHVLVQDSPSGLQIPQQQDGSVFSSQSPVSPSNSTRRVLSHFEFQSHGDDDWVFVGHLHESSRCYLPETLFRTPGGGVKTARQLQEDDHVEGLDRTLQVVCKEATSLQ